MFALDLILTRTIIVVCETIGAAAGKDHEIVELAGTEEYSPE